MITQLRPQHVGVALCALALVAGCSKSSTGSSEGVDPQFAGGMDSVAKITVNGEAWQGEFDASCKKIDDFIMLTATAADQSNKDRADIELSGDGTAVHDVNLGHPGGNALEVNQYADTPPQVTRDGNTFTISGTGNDVGVNADPSAPKPTFEAVFECAHDPTQ